jgi:hypothetical protein
MMLPSSSLVDAVYLRIRWGGINWYTLEYKKHQTTQVLMEDVLIWKDWR